MSLLQDPGKDGRQHVGSVFFFRGQDDMKTLAPGAAAKHVLTYTIQYPANYIITHRIHGGRPIPGFGLEEKQK